MYSRRSRRGSGSSSSRTGSLAETARAFSQREEEEEERPVTSGERIRAALRPSPKRNSAYHHSVVPSAHPYTTATTGDFTAAVLPSKPLGRMDSWSKRKAGVAKAVEGVVKRRKHIVLVGLDGSGKTTVLTRLKYRCYVATTPTIGFNHEKVWGGGYRWSCWDVGGGERLRPLWSSYTRATDGIVFVVDSASLPDMMEEARVELARVLKKSRASSVQLGIPSPPLLVLANFQDQIHARSAQCVAVSLGLGEAMGVVWAVAPVCALTGEGLDDAMATLRTLIDKVRQEARRRDRWR